MISLRDKYNIDYHRLFGPRRKMESIISRLTSDIQTRLTDRPEAAYADGLSAKLQFTQTKLKQVSFQEFYPSVCFQLHSY